MANPVPEMGNDPAARGALNNPAAPDEPGCTKTMPVMPQMTAGPVETVWTSTATVTKSVDCGGCNEVQTAVMDLGPGPVVFFTTTTTVETASTTTVLACSTSAAGQ
ncbi:hypothetical protein H634G_02236 [Metarhizium anisopliae BRIP 53293]|uniref:Uncharacterized protein n=1 Tax=Metarhizium anisopliae BRIP 53293 TaxID=1291518 RepID=A0A0D9P7C5_METAN|nr:hypothetical protein H634G_02236 [Metarhizium anisopliae BRIP 53293]KJK89934.1 hypothetical protein H633G_06174 [Metarhizium anisopliae BRIP 53284]